MKDLNRVRDDSVDYSGNVSNKTESGCGPDCNCGEPAKSNKIKTATGLIILMVLGGISIFKVVNARQQNDMVSINQAESSYASVLIETDPGPGQVDEKTGRSNETQRLGQYLDSLTALNRVAMNQDAVFVYIPENDENAIDNNTYNAVLSAQKTLKSQNITLGLYTLKSDTAEYTRLSTQIRPPVVMVASKGKGTATVSGEITETKLLQAFTASSRASGGCGPSCKPGGC